MNSIVTSLFFVLGGIQLILLISKKGIKLFVIILAIIAVLGVGAVLTMGRDSSEGQEMPTINPNVGKSPIEHGNEDSDYIAFACNVDWGNESIPKMLETLREKEVKITFFVTGRWAKEYPELFQEIADEGHEIASHGYQHLNYDTLGLQENMDQIKRAEEEIQKITGVKPTLFSPPSGAYNDNTLKAAEELGYQTILWSIDTIDWRKGSTQDVIKNRVLDKENHNGAIVLMHPMEETAKALPQLIDSLREKGLEVGRVSDVLE